MPILSGTMINISVKHERYSTSNLQLRERRRIFLYDNIYNLLNQRII